MHGMEVPSWPKTSHLTLMSTTGIDEKGNHHVRRLSKRGLCFSMHDPLSTSRGDWLLFSSGLRHQDCVQLADILSSKIVDARRGNEIYRIDIMIIYILDT